MTEEEKEEPYARMDLEWDTDADTVCSCIELALLIARFQMADDSYIADLERLKKAAEKAADEAMKKDRQLHPEDYK
jgi:hypothetical protein